MRLSRRLALGATVLTTIGAARVVAGLIACSTDPLVCVEPNAWGISGWMPLAMSVALGIVAVALMRAGDLTHRAMAVLWAASAWGFARAPIMRAGWPEIGPWWALLVISPAIVLPILGLELLEGRGSRLLVAAAAVSGMVAISLTIDTGDIRPVAVVAYLVLAVLSLLTARAHSLRRAT